MCDPDKGPTIHLNFSDFSYVDSQGEPVFTAKLVTDKSQNSYYQLSVLDRYGDHQWHSAGASGYNSTQFGWIAAQLNAEKLLRSLGYSPQQEEYCIVSIKCVHDRYIWNKVAVQDFSWGVAPHSACIQIK